MRKVLLAVCTIAVLAVGMISPAAADEDLAPTWEYSEGSSWVTAEIETHQPDDYFKHDPEIRLQITCSSSSYRLGARLSLTNPTLAWAKQGGVSTLHTVLSTKKHGHTTLAWNKSWGSGTQGCLKTAKST